MMVQSNAEGINVHADLALDVGDQLPGEVAGHRQGFAPVTFGAVAAACRVVTLLSLIAVLVLI
ncbi:hypothetical protein [Streptomyces dysideae]|uniref:Uncharacterized protein n=1 Tax=Streptomyces dysideae TaxID=909626 RepID=A0A101UPB1_9ACTN|nr:hypothetical protein [Streptomyces dysideae]KUO14340.1 hypothetical protein AQJ91_47350 [Streptomyces dysideae]